MGINIIGIEIPLENIVGNEPLKLFRADKLYDYKDNKITDTQLGMKFLVGESGEYQRFTVKILGLKESPIPLERIGDKSKPIFVTFKDAIARTYRNNDGEIDISVKASSISEAKDPK